MAVAESPSFASATVNTYTVKTTTASSALSSATDSLASVAIPTNTDLILGKKLIMGMEVTSGVVFSDVAASLTLEVSHTGTDWVTYATLSADTTPNIAGVKLFVVDTTDLAVPYARLHFNSGGLSVGTTGTAKFFHAYK